MENILLEFLKASRGQWFVQQNIYNLWEDKVWSSKSNINYSVDVKVDDSLQKYPLFTYIPEYRLIKLLGHNTISYFIVDTRANNNSSKGLIFRFSQASPTTYVQGTFCIDKNQVLVILIQDGNKSIYEKVWFENTNFKLNFRIIKQFGYSVATAFSSELRVLA